MNICDLVVEIITLVPESTISGVWLIYFEIVKEGR